MTEIVGHNQVIVDSDFIKADNDSKKCHNYVLKKSKIKEKEEGKGKYINHISFCLTDNTIDCNYLRAVRRAVR